MGANDPTNRDSSGDTNVVEHAYDAGTPVSTAVVQALADLENVEPPMVRAKLGITLYEHIDAAGLDTLLERGTNGGELVISFEIDASDTYSVEIGEGSHVRVRALS